MKRKIIDQLITWKNRSNRLPLILKGARQTGKTFVLKSFAQQEFSNYIYLNFEENPLLAKIFDKNLDPHRILNEIQLLFETSFDSAHDLLIFDEIQAAPLALNALKYFKEKMPDSYICAAGSLLGIHLSETSFPVGCVEFFQLYPLSFEEFIWAHPQKQLSQYFLEKNADVFSEVVHEKFWELFRHYLIVGGMPAIVSKYFQHQQSGDKNDHEIFKDCRQAQRQLVLSYGSDFAKHAGKINSMHIERTFESVARQLGQDVDGNVPPYTFKDVLPGKIGYRELAGPIDWLKKASLILPSMICDKANLPLNAFTKNNRFKLYCFDVGLLGAMMGLPPKSILDYDFGTYKGFLVENFVACELVANEISSQLFSWKEGSAEIEFLLVDDVGIIPVEVKSGKNRRAKSLKVYQEKYSPIISLKLTGEMLNAALCGKNRHTKVIPIYFTCKWNDFI